MSRARSPSSPDGSLRRLVFGVAVFIGLASAACGGSVAHWTPPLERTIEPASNQVLRASSSAAREAHRYYNELVSTRYTALSLFEAGRFTEASTLFEQLALYPSLVAELGIERARALLIGRSDPVAALEVLSECPAAHDRRSECLELRAVALESAGRNQESTLALRELLDLDPERSDVLERLGRLLLLLGQPTEAVEVIRAALQSSPRDVRLLLLMARALEAVGDLRAAEAAFLQVRALHRDRVIGGNYLLRFYERNGRTSDARRVRSEVNRELDRRRPSRSMRSM